MFPWAEQVKPSLQAALAPDCGQQVSPGPPHEPHRPDLQVWPGS
jgi:hypothetical protein